jgi:GcrA cell cycle regulator
MTSIRRRNSNGRRTETGTPGIEPKRGFPVVTRIPPIAEPVGDKRGHRSTTWTSARLDHLRARWIEGASARRISWELGAGISRSAVLGKVYRLGIGDLSPRGGIQVRRRSRAEGHREVGVRRELTAKELMQHRALLDRIAGDGACLDDPGLDSGIPVEQRRSLLELTHMTCRWPVGDPGRPGFFFCGAAPVRGAPYCQLHGMRAHRSAERVPRPAISRSDRSQQRSTRP